MWSAIMLEQEHVLPREVLETDAQPLRLLCKNVWRNERQRRIDSLSNAKRHSKMAQDTLMNIEGICNIICVFCWPLTRITVAMFKLWSRLLGQVVLYECFTKPDNSYMLWIHEILPFEVLTTFSLGHLKSSGCQMSCRRISLRAGFQFDGPLRVKKVSSLMCVSIVGTRTFLAGAAESIR